MQLWQPWWRSWERISTTQLIGWCLPQEKNLLCHIDSRSKKTLNRGNQTTKVLVPFDVMFARIVPVCSLNLDFEMNILEDNNDLSVEPVAIPGVQDSQPNNPLPRTISKYDMTKNLGNQADRMKGVVFVICLPMTNPEDSRRNPRSLEPSAQERPWLIMKTRKITNTRSMSYLFLRRIHTFKEARVLLNLVGGSDKEPRRAQED